MAVPRKMGLGRGLSELLEDIKSPTAAPQTLPVADIVANPRQPRRNFDASQLSELTQSVRDRGVLQPILVRPIGQGRYEVIAGERRLRASQAAGLAEIPALVREMDDAAALEVSIVENVQRTDLNPIEEAESYQRLIGDFGHTQEVVGKLIGKSRSHVANLIRLLELAPPVRLAVVEGKITMGHARALLTAPDSVALMSEVMARGLSVRQTEARAASNTNAVVKSATVAASQRDPDLASLEKRLCEALGMPVNIVSKGDAGRVEIGFGSLDQLDMVCQRLSAGRI